MVLKSPVMMEQLLDISIRAEDNTYESQLTVSVSSQLVGTRISCFYDIGGIRLIGSSVLILITGNTSLKI